MDCLVILFTDAVYTLDCISKHNDGSRALFGMRAIFIRGESKAMSLFIIYFNLCI